VRLHLLAEQGTGLLARRATQFSTPPTVWTVVGRELVTTEPEPVPDPVPIPPAAHAAAEPLRDQGLDVIVDHGEIAGELLGLEVARVVVDAAGDARLEVGVGRHDRDAYRALHGERDPADALAAVVQTVATHRRPGAEPHPLNRLAAERWLRARAVADPAWVGAAELFPVEGTVPRASIKDPSPAAAVGTDRRGRPVVVVASTGVDLDLVPAAADVRLAFAPEARLVLLVPERDAHPVTAALAAALVEPAEVLAVPGDWRQTP
jgi:hypothetical protein